MSYDRRARFRAAVYAPREGMTNGCRVVLLRLADSMNAKGVVSLPRSRLAKELGVHPSRISENIALARALGFLGTVRRGRPGVTAVYQGQIPPPDMVRSPGGDMVRPSAPCTSPTWCGTAVSQVGNADQPPAAPAHGDVQDDKQQRGERELGRVTGVRFVVDEVPNDGNEERAG